MIIGIDCGLTGAVAFLDDKTAPDVVDIPTESFGTGSVVKNQICAAALAILIRQRCEQASEVKAFVEKVNAMPGQGVSSVFSFGQSLGTILGVLGALQVPVEMIRPQRWKAFFSLTQDKEVSRTRAINIFPQIADKLQRKKDHNRAEALLLAEYGRRADGPR